MLATKKTYAEKLRDPRWQRKRLEIMQRDGWKCADCKNESDTLNVHHAYYRKALNPWEYPDESLMTLCEPCHEMAEEIKRRFEEFVFSHVPSIQYLIYDRIFPPGGEA